MSASQSESQPAAYLTADQRDTTEFLTTEEVPTAVVKATDYPMDELRTLFDTAFSGMFPALGERNIEPVGPAYALYSRMPSETVDIEVGVPISGDLSESVELDGGFTVEQSSLPATDAAVVSRFGGYDDLGDAWTEFLTDLSSTGQKPQLPYWEVYVTEPSEDADPATLRTDLYTAIEGDPTV